MSDQQFCLRWNNHQSTLVSVFDTLLENNVLVDCTLAAEGQFLKAHKVVLCACSPYLEALLSEHYEKHPILILKDVKFQELKSMMDYMYKGEVNISQDQLGTFLKAAESLQIKGLTDGTGDDSRDVGSTQPKRHEPPRKIPHNQQPRSPAVLPHSSAGLTIEPRRSSAHDVPNSPIRSREGSASPTPRKRRRPRRPSQGDDYEPSYDNNDSQNTAIVPTSNQISSTPNAIPKIQPPETDDNDEISRIAEAGLMKEKTEPPSEYMEPKTEYIEETPTDDNVEDLTLDDDDDLDGMDMGAGPSHSNDNSNQGYGWGIGDRSDDMYLSQDGGTRDNQDQNTPVHPVKRGRGRPFGTKKRIDKDGTSMKKVTTEPKPRGRPIGSKNKSPRFEVRAGYKSNVLRRPNSDEITESLSNVGTTSEQINEGLNQRPPNAERRGRPRKFLTPDQMKKNSKKIIALLERSGSKKRGKTSILVNEAQRSYIIKEFLKSPFITSAQAKVINEHMPHSPSSRVKRWDTCKIQSWFERTRHFVKRGLYKFDKYDNDPPYTGDSNFNNDDSDEYIDDNTMASSARKEEDEEEEAEEEVEEEEAEEEEHEQQCEYDDIYFEEVDDEEEEISFEYSKKNVVTTAEIGTSTSVDYCGTEFIGVDYLMLLNDDDREQCVVVNNIDDENINRDANGNDDDDDGDNGNSDEHANGNNDDDDGDNGNSDEHANGNDDDDGDNGNNDDDGDNGNSDEHANGNNDDDDDDDNGNSDEHVNGNNDDDGDNGNNDEHANGNNDDDGDNGNSDEHANGNNDDGDDNGNSDEHANVNNDDDENAGENDVLVQEEPVVDNLNENYIGVENLSPNQIETLNNIVKVFGYITPVSATALAEQFSTVPSVIHEWYRSQSPARSAVVDDNDGRIYRQY